MAGTRDEKLPNLKICIDNTESDKNVNDVVSIHGTEDFQHSPLEYEEDERSVEFNVRIGKLKSANTTGTFRQPSKVYENRAGDFVTGIDITKKEEIKKKSERAKRFGLDSAEDKQSADLNGLYKSFGFRSEDLHRDHRGIRLEAIHFRGLTNMHTKDIFSYFQEFGPRGVEWIDDMSCNVVWLDNLSTARAMLKLSKSYDEITKQYDGDGSDNAEEDVKEGTGKESNKKKSKVKKKSRKKSPTTSSSSSSSDEDDDHKRKTLNIEEDYRRKKEDYRRKKATEDDDDVLDLLEENDNIKLTHVNGSHGVVENKTRETDPVKKPDLRKDDKEKSSIKTKIKKKSNSSSSSSSSSSGSSSSSSGSSSTSGSSSSSSSGSSSDEEMDTSTKEIKDKKVDKCVKSMAGHKAPDIPWPPGKWRLGNPYKQTKYLFLRYATKADKKLPGAEKRSKFYVEHGNPNYSGMKGFISGSRKRRLRATQYKEEVKEAREAVRAKRDTVTYDDVDIFGEDSLNLKMDQEECDFGTSVTDHKTVEERLGIIKPLDDVEEGELGASSGEEDMVSSDTRIFENKPIDEEAMEMEKELQVLLKSPPKRKMMMKMYADEVEEQIQIKRRKKEGGLTITTDNRSQEDARRLITGKPTSTAVDLRSKLKSRRTSSWDI